MEDEALIRKEEGRRGSGGRDRTNKVERAFLFYSASLLSALKVRRHDTQSRNV